MTLHSQCLGDNQSVWSSVPVVSRWLWSRNRAILEVTSMMVDSGFIAQWEEMKGYDSFFFPPHPYLCAAQSLSCSSYFRHFLLLSQLLKCWSLKLMHWDTFNQDNYRTVGGDEGCSFCEVQAGTTSPMPDYEGFTLQ